MTIYTRRGDAGETSLAGGERVPKTDPRVEAYGTVDEANCAVGAARALTDDPLLREVLLFAQQRLFNCSSHVATPPDARTRRTTDVDDEDVARSNARSTGSRSRRDRSTTSCPRRHARWPRSSTLRARSCAGRSDASSRSTPRTMATDGWRAS